MSLKLAGDKWYKAAVYAAVPIFGIGAFGQERGTIAFAVGVLLLGLGEWINHPYREKLQLNDYGVVVAKLMGEGRENKLFGVLLDVIGAAFIAMALWRLTIWIVA